MVFDDLIASLGACDLPVSRRRDDASLTKVLRDRLHVSVGDVLKTDSYDYVVVDVDRDAVRKGNLCMTLMTIDHIQVDIHNIQDVIQEHMSYLQNKIRSTAVFIPVGENFSNVYVGVVDYTKSNLYKEFIELHYGSGIKIASFDNVSCKYSPYSLYNGFLYGEECYCYPVTFSKIFTTV